MACLLCEGSPSTHPLLSYCGVWRKEQEAGCGEVKHTAVTAHSCLSPGSAAHSVHNLHGVPSIFSFLFLRTESNSEYCLGGGGTSVLYSAKGLAPITTQSKWATAYAAQG